MKLSGRTKRYIDLARKVAVNSAFPEHKHGAILVKGGSVLNVAFNANKFVPWGNRFRSKSCGHATHHAELGCVLGIAREKTQGAVVYVVRIGRMGDMKNSKPCPMCEQILRHVGVKKVIYSINDNHVECCKL